MIRQRAVIRQVLHEAVMRVGFQHIGYAGLHFAVAESAAFLPDILLDAHRGHVKLLVVPAGRRVAEKREGGSVGHGLVSGEVKARMRGRDKCRYGPSFLAEAHFAGVYVDADAAAARQFVQVASFGKLDPFIFRDGKSIPPGAAYYIQRGILEDIALAVGIHYIRRNVHVSLD